MNAISRAAASWSGGKDSALALYRTLNDERYEVAGLLNMVNRDAGRSMSHGLKPELIAAQADALQIPVVQTVTTWDTYEDSFKQAVTGLVRQGVDAVVFGDIDIPEHREWTERVCEELGVTPIQPLWGEDPHTLLEEFIDAGFEAVIVAARADTLGRERLGRRLDAGLLDELYGMEAEGKVHPCGEHGEYHTFVTDGPIFKKRIEVETGRTVTRDGLHFLDIESCRLVARAESRHGR
jgi:diphthine-ammonia ligase